MSTSSSSGSGGRNAKGKQPAEKAMSPPATATPTAGPIAKSPPPTKGGTGNLGPKSHPPTSSSSTSQNRPTSNGPSPRPSPLNSPTKAAAALAALAHGAPGARRGLPYEPDTLHWVHDHTQNLESVYCYCGGDRNLNEVNLQCGTCRNWFHGSCLSAALKKLPMVPFITDYSFTCALCVRAEKKMTDDQGDWPGEERFTRLRGAKWEHAVVTTIANLALKRMQETKRSMHDPKIPEGERDYYFEKNKHVCPYIDKNWKAVCPFIERSANAWTNVGSCLYSSRTLFVPFDPNTRNASAPFTLVERNLYNLRPGFVEKFDPSSASASASSSTSAPTASSSKDTAGSQPAAATATDSAASPSAAGGGGRKKDKKRRVDQDDAASSNPADEPLLFDPLLFSGGRKTVEQMQLNFVAPDTWDIEHPYNKDGYKYDFAESNPANVFKSAHFRPQQFFRSRVGMSPVYLSPTDRSTRVEVSADGMEASNTAGFRSVRSNVGVKEGNWYFEVKIVKGGSDGRTESDAEGRTGANVRLGWTRREATLGAPIGYDSYGYGYRDKTGEKLHESLPAPYAEGFGTGDVIGCFISLPKMKGNVGRSVEAIKEAEEKKREEEAARVAAEAAAAAAAANAMDEDGVEGGEDPVVNELLLPDNKLELICDLDKLPPGTTDMFAEKRHRPPIKFRLGLFMESRDYQPINQPPLITSMMLSHKPTLKSHSTPITERTLPWYARLLSKDFPTLFGSYISFYKNGKSQGVAFKDIAAPIPAAAAVPEDHRKPLESFLPEPPVTDDGTIGYYPTVSLFCGGTVRLNFGPDFEFPPEGLEGVDWKPLCERLAEREAEETLADLLDEVTAAPAPYFYVPPNMSQGREDTPMDDASEEGAAGGGKPKAKKQRKKEIKGEK